MCQLPAVRGTEPTQLFMEHLRRAKDTNVSFKFHDSTRRGSPRSTGRRGRWPRDHMGSRTRARQPPRPLASAKDGEAGGQCPQRLLAPWPHQEHVSRPGQLSSVLLWNLALGRASVCERGHVCSCPHVHTSDIFAPGEVQGLGPLNGDSNSLCIFSLGLAQVPP